MWSVSSKSFPLTLPVIGENYKLEVTKVYPEVKDGQFRTDFRFTTGRPENIRAGQTYHINLQLGDPVKAVLIPRGGFFQITGGRWIYVVDESGKFAVRTSYQDWQAESSVL